MFLKSCREVDEEGDVLQNAWKNGGRKIPPEMSESEAKCKARDKFRDSEILKVVASTDGHFGTRLSFIINFGSHYSINIELTRGISVTRRIEAVRHPTISAHETLNLKPYC